MRSNPIRPALAPSSLAVSLLAGLSSLWVAGSPSALASSGGIITPTAPIPSPPAIVPEAPPTGAGQPPSAEPAGASSPAAKLTAPSTDPNPAPAPEVPPAAAIKQEAPPAAPVNNSRILLALGKREIRLERDGNVYGPWPVAIGDPATPTPLGTFKVINKVVNPQYVSTKSGKKKGSIGPNGPLGDRWIGFSTKGPNQFGIHGTPSAWSWTVSSRSAVTNGCVRMFHQHVRKLFEMVEVGTPVVVVR
ncbi:L,D-transpeptidase family protein [Synechococcus sp. CS-205]|jgi:lipoprotein-anchoring transpeptidase ErfK/SrfK|uniref:L,D-transpeptidase family protein n=1 Tax=Synechococcus sp. CS-205 TaxID=2847984 RepID=UPI00223BAF8B|nr:L,D-transpeptidase family protein [Synechococcus sp. CS-205]